VAQLRETIAFTLQSTLQATPNNIVLRVAPLPDGASATAADDSFPDQAQPLRALGFVSGCKLYVYTTSIASTPAGPTRPPLTRDSTWSCPQCTLRNTLSSTTCGVCGWVAEPAFLVAEFGVDVITFLSGASAPRVVAAVRPNEKFPPLMWSWFASTPPATRDAPSTTPGSQPPSLQRMLSSFGRDEVHQLVFSLLVLCAHFARVQLHHGALSPLLASNPLTFIPFSFSFAFESFVYVYAAKP
jgi:hypothetical protein